MDSFFTSYLNFCNWQTRNHCTCSCVNTRLFVQKLTWVITNWSKTHITPLFIQVESPACAAALKALDKQINLSPNDAFVLRINVSTSPAPQMIMNDQAVGKIFSYSLRIEVRCVLIKDAVVRFRISLSFFSNCWSRQRFWWRLNISFSSFHEAGYERSFQQHNRPSRLEPLSQWLCIFGSRHLRTLVARVRHEQRHQDHQRERSSSVLRRSVEK